MKKTGYYLVFCFYFVKRSMAVVSLNDGMGGEGGAKTLYANYCMGGGGFRNHTSGASCPFAAALTGDCGVTCEGEYSRAAHGAHWAAGCLAL